MKRVFVNAGKIALIYQRGNFKRMIAEGAHWLNPFEVAEEYDIFKPFTPKEELDILLRNSELSEKLDVWEVKDCELAILYENGIFKNVLLPGRYAFWKETARYSYVIVNLGKPDITENVEMSLLQRKELLPFIRVYVVEPYEMGLLYRDGNFERLLKPGVYHFWKNTTLIHVPKVDMRQMQLEISGQEMLTRDKAALRVNFYTQYRVTDVMKALHENKDFEKQLYMVMQLALRTYTGNLMLDELLEKKETVADYLLPSLNEKTERLGVTVLDCGIRDVILPGEVKEIMNQVLIAQKKAQANIITRREETASTRSLLNTARLLEDNEMLFRLKEMEYVEKIADKISSISLSGGNQLVEQLKDIFISKK